MTSASAVSRALRASGLGVVPTRTREGLHVSGTGIGRTAYVTAQHVSEREAGIAIRNATEVLTELGYTVREVSANIIGVTRED